MTIRAAVAIPVLVAAVLAGCAGPSPTAGPTPTPDPTPVPTAAPPTHPDPVLPVSCADLVSDPSVAVGAPVTPRFTESTPLAETHEIMYREVGILTCEWGEGQASDGWRWADLLHLDVLPDGAADYAEYLEYAGDDGGALDTAGDRSQFRCYPPEEWGLRCGFHLVVDGYWVQGFTRLSTATRSEAEGSTEIQALLDGVTAAVRGADDPRPLPTRSPDGFDGDVFCAEGSIPGLEQAFEVAPLWNSGGDFDGLYAAAYHRASVATCSYASEDPGVYVSLQTVPGAADAVDVLRYSPPEHPRFGAFAPVDVGTLAAVVACSAADCVAHVAVDGSLVTVSQTLVTRERFLAHLDALRAAFGLVS